MAKFQIRENRHGEEGSSLLTRYVSIAEIEFEEGDEVVCLPDTYKGKPITHLGYGEKFVPAHEEWADWHHPGKGSDWVPDSYERKYLTFRVPIHVKKIVIPATIKDICYCAFEFAKHVTFEVDPNNPYYTVNKKGKIIDK